MFTERDRDLEYRRWLREREAASRGDRPPRHPKSSSWQQYPHVKSAIMAQQQVKRHNSKKDGLLMLQLQQQQPQQQPNSPRSRCSSPKPKAKDGTASKRSRQCPPTGSAAMLILNRNSGGKMMDVFGVREGQKSLPPRGKDKEKVRDRERKGDREKDRVRDRDRERDREKEREREQRRRKKERRRLKKEKKRKSKAAARALRTSVDGTL